jgi:AcrR family transcriptional regulator
MSTEDIDQISITDVAREADINRKTFYAHYSGVSDVITEIEDQTIEALTELVDRCSFNSTRFNISPLFEGCTRLINEDPDFHKSLFLADSYNSLFSKIRSVLVDRFVTEFERNTQLGHMEAKYLACYIMGGALNMYQQWIVSDYDDIPLREISDTASRFCSDTILIASNAAVTTPDRQRTMAGKCHP